MTENIKIIFNGQEVELPPQIHELFSQLTQQEAIPSPHPFFPKPPPLFPTPKPVLPTQQIVKMITICKDVPVRNVVMDLNQRVKRLEELLNVKASAELEKSLKIPFTKKKIPTKKIISKTKETPETKGKSKVKPKSKEKAKVTKKKIGKKK